MDDGFASYDLLVQRLSHGDIVSLYNWSPDSPDKKLLIKKTGEDDVRCIFLEEPPASMPSVSVAADWSIRRRWRAIVERSTHPVARVGNNVRYNSNGSAFCERQCTFATVREDSLRRVMAGGVAKIDNQLVKAAELRKSGFATIRIPCQEDAKRFMEEASESVGSRVLFDPVFSNSEHWATKVRYNAGWSTQVDKVISDVGVWYFITEAAAGDPAAVSHFFRSFGDYDQTPLGRQCVALINQVLPAVTMFNAEVETLGRAVRLTQANLRLMASACTAIGIMMSVLTWFWASLRDIVTRPREQLLTSAEEARHVYESIDHYPVACNMGSIACSLVPAMWERFVSWLLGIASKILLLLESRLPLLSS